MPPLILKYLFIMFDLIVIKDLLKWHVYVYPIKNGDIIDFKQNDKCDEIQNEIHRSYCSYPNKEELMDKHFFLLKRYGFLEGNPPDDSYITPNGQEFYDLLNIPKIAKFLYENKTYFEDYPLNILHSFIKNKAEELINNKVI